MSKINVEVAGYIIQLQFAETEYASINEWYIPTIKDIFNGFIIQYTPKKIDFTIQLVWNMRPSLVHREKENEYFAKICNFPSSVRMVTYYQNSINHFQLALWHALDRLLLKDNGFMVHAAASLVDRKVHLFLGESGAGKSTASKLLKGKFEKIADDALIIKKNGGKYVCYQMPYLEKEGGFTKSSKKYLLGNIYFLKKAKIFNQMVFHNKNIALRLLLEQVYSNKKTYLKREAIVDAFVRNNQNIFYLKFANEKIGMINFFSDESNK